MTALIDQKMSLAKNLEEKRFWIEMEERGFSVEQMISFLQAPSRAMGGFGLSREKIMERTIAGWQSRQTNASSVVSDIISSPRKAPLLAIGALGAATTCSLIGLYGVIFNDPAATQTGQVMAQGFDKMQLVQAVASQAINTLLSKGMVATSAGLLVSALYFSGVRQAANRKSSLGSVADLEEKLSQTPAPGSLSDKINDYRLINKKLEEIKRPYHRLLSHLNSSEVRMFLAGDDEVRRQILTANPPSYEQRMLCLQDLNQTTRGAWNADLKLAGQAWTGVLAHGPVCLEACLAKMRLPDPSCENDPTAMPGVAPRPSCASKPARFSFATGVFGVARYGQPGDAGPKVGPAVG